MKIAGFFDYDGTLSEKETLEVLLDEYNISSSYFWMSVHDEVRKLRSEGIHTDTETAYLNKLIDYVRSGRMPGLSRERLREIGCKTPLREGVPELFNNLKEDLPEAELSFYIISSGIVDMMVAGPVNDYVDAMIGAAFDEQDGVISRITNVIGKSRKQDFIHAVSMDPSRCEFRFRSGEIGAGPENRAIPIHNMFYVGDGSTDDVAFNTVKAGGGYCLKVYAGTGYFARQDLEAGKVDQIATADFRRTGEAYQKLKAALTCMVRR